MQAGRQAGLQPKKASTTSHKLSLAPWPASGPASPPAAPGGGGGGDFGPKYQAHVGELQRQLDEARAALEEKDQQLAALAEERQAAADELSMLKGMGGGSGGGAAMAGLAAAELACEWLVRSG